MGILSFFGCVKKTEKLIYMYNSEEYHQKITNFNISIDEAAQLASKFLIKEKNINKGELVLNIVYGDYYIFSTTSYFYNPKTTRYNLSGVWVNGKTGDIIEKQTKDYVEVILKIPFTSTTRYRLDID